MPSYIQIECPCGRTLRTPKDRAEPTIRCWDCRATHVVPAFQSRALLARACLGSAREILNFEGVLGFLAGGLAVAFALAVPEVGPALGLALAAMAGGLYLEQIRRIGLRGGPAPPVSDRRHWLRCGAWGSVVALGFTAPFLLRHGIMDSSGRLLSWRGPGVAAVAAACWLAAPLVALLTSASDRAGPVPARRVLAAMRRHYLTTIAALLLLPLGLLALEAVLIGCFVEQGWFGYLVMDLFPNPASDRVLPRVENDPVQDPTLLPFSFFWRVYLHGLELGYSLLGAMPASLARGPALRARPWFPLVSPWHYPAIRVLDSALILAAVGLILAVQARWLGLIASIDARPGAREESEGP